MSAEEEETPVARRIVVTLDASACGRAALETAAQRAAQMQAELWGLFVGRTGGTADPGLGPNC